MARTRSSASRRFSHRLTIAALLVTAGMLQGCGTNRDGMSTGSIPDDYRTRHPITLADTEHTVDIPVSAGDARMTVGTRDVVQGFIDEYKTRSTGIIQIQFPHGSVNAGAASYQRRELRALLGKAGIASPRIVETSYQAGATGDAAPIRMSFMAMTAMTDECGQWPEDIANNTVDNKNWHNFGCATQNNLAAQIANPMDLVAPRAMSPIDAKRRTNVIGLYRDGTASSGSTTTTTTTTN